MESAFLVHILHIHACRVKIFASHIGHKQNIIGGNCGQHTREAKTCSKAAIRKSGIGAAFLTRNFEIALQMKAKGMHTNLIDEFTRLSIDEIEKL